VLKAVIDTNILVRLIVNDDENQREACVRLLEKAKHKELQLYLLPVSVLETVWVMEKYYKLPKKTVREFIEAILNTREIICEMEEMFKKALAFYEGKNIKFADAIIGCWGMENGIDSIYTYDDKDFKRIDGLKVLKPE
jgi:predicted nucleic-acid-binding protein